jgi:hypothetical protein
MRQRLRPHLTYANVIGTVALFVALGGTTYAATGGNFILGQSNSASSTTGLSAGTTGPAFRVTNTSTGTAGSFNAATGHPALAVNTSAKVSKLNADLLDGKDSTAWKSSDVLAPFVGPLPVQNTFTSSGGKLLFMASGSGFRASTNNSPGRMGMAVYVDDVQFFNVFGFSNEFNSHKPFVPAYQVFSGIPAGTHTVRLQALSDGNCGTSDNPFNTCTSTDGVDLFYVAVMETPF